MNEVHLSGRVMKVWDIGGDRFARISIPRDNDRPARHDGGRYDYLTVRFPNGRDKSIGLNNGQDVIVHGFMQSRDYQESLADFLKGAQGLQGKPDFKKANPNEVMVNRSTTEVVAMRFRILNSK